MGSVFCLSIVFFFSSFFINLWIRWAWRRDSVSLLPLCFKRGWFSVLSNSEPMLSSDNRQENDLGCQSHQMCEIVKRRRERAPHVPLSSCYSSWRVWSFYYFNTECGFGCKNVGGEPPDFLGNQNTFAAKITFQIFQKPMGFYLEVL